MAIRGIPDRAAGVQLHVTSLPGGRLGEPARDFVRWLSAAGQTVWQVLPLTVPDAHGSPYASPSAFAAWPGLLEDPGASVTDDEVAAFADEHAYWAGSWAAHGGDLADQVRFEREWAALRAFAADHGVRVMGDIPIYVAAGSADAATWPDLFRDDAVAGVPPDAFTDTGQLWGNPLYDWAAMAADEHRWWVERLRRHLALHDLVRIDHFRGFEAFWAVPAGDATAEHGRWEPGPGPRGLRRGVRAARPAAGRRRGPRRHRRRRSRSLRDALGFPGMARPAVRLRPRRRGPAPRAGEPRATRSSTPAPTTTTPSSAGGTPCRSDVAARCAAPVVTPGITDPDPPWALIRLAHAAPCRLAVVAGPGRAVAGLGGPDEHPGHRGHLVVELAPGAVDRRPGGAAARGHRGARTPGLTGPSGSAPRVGGRG